MKNKVYIMEEIEKSIFSEFITNSDFYVNRYKIDTKMIGDLTYEIYLRVKAILEDKY